MKIKNFYLYNCTSHRLDLTDAEPASLNERIVELSVPVDYTINGDWVDTTRTESSVKLTKRKLRLDREEVLTALRPIIAKHKGTSDIVLVVVARPVLECKHQLEQWCREAFGYVPRFVGVISATKRHIKPPVACMCNFCEE